MQRQCQIRKLILTESILQAVRKRIYWSIKHSDHQTFEPTNLSSFVVIVFAAYETRRFGTGKIGYPQTI